MLPTPQSIRVNLVYRGALLKIRMLYQKEFEPNVHRVCDMNLVCIKHEPSSLVMKKSLRKHKDCLKKIKIADQNFKIVNGSSQSAEIKIRDNEDNRIKYEWSKYQAAFSCFLKKCNSS